MHHKNIFVARVDRSVLYPRRIKFVPVHRFFFGFHSVQSLISGWMSASHLQVSTFDDEEAVPMPNSILVIAVNGELVLSNNDRLEALLQENSREKDINQKILKKVYRIVVRNPHKLANRFRTDPNTIFMPLPMSPLYRHNDSFFLYISYAK